MGQFTLAAIEQNNLDLLKEIVNYGGDVTLLTSSGNIPFHSAISGGNTEIVQFLLDQGADVDRPDVHGLTARGLADHQGQEEIQALIRTRQETEKKTSSHNATAAAAGEAASLEDYCKMWQ